VYDIREKQMPNLGMVQMEDEETGELMWVNTSSKRVRRSYGAHYQERVDYFKNAFTKAGAGYLNCNTAESYVKKLLGYFKQRA
jgi:hypothetical protein